MAHKEQPTRHRQTSIGGEEGGSEDDRMTTVDNKGRQVVGAHRVEKGDQMQVDSLDYDDVPLSQYFEARGAIARNSKDLRIPQAEWSSKMSSLANAMARDGQGDGIAAIKEAHVKSSKGLSDPVKKVEVRRSSFPGENLRNALINLSSLSLLHYFRISGSSSRPSCKSKVL